MITNNGLWEKLADPEYRRYFVEELAKRAFATQVRTIRKKRDWSQEKLAEESQVTQGVVSRTENPTLGTTFDTAAQVATGFGLAFIPKIVPYSEFIQWAEDVSDGFTDLPTFEQEKSALDREKQASLVPPKKGQSKADEASTGYRGSQYDQIAAELRGGEQEWSGISAAAGGR